MDGIDALIHPRGVSIDAALATVDEVAHAMERKWGIGRLERLVEPDLAAKFVSAQEKLNKAIETNDVAQVVKRAEIMRRGWVALDAAAEAAGASSLPEGTWVVEFKGQRYTVVLEGVDALSVAHRAPNPDKVVTMHELMVAWTSFAGLDILQQAKLQFPGAEMTEVRPKGSGKLNDDIPF